MPRPRGFESHKLSDRSPLPYVTRMTSSRVLNKAPNYLTSGMSDRGATCALFQKRHSWLFQPLLRTMASSRSNEWLVRRGLCDLAFYTASPVDNAQDYNYRTPAFASRQTLNILVSCFLFLINLLKSFLLTTSPILELRVNVNFTCDHRKRCNTVKTARNVAVDFSRSRHLVSVPPLYSNVTQSLAYRPEYDSLGSKLAKSQALGWSNGENTVPLFLDV